MTTRKPTQGLFLEPAKYGKREGWYAKWSLKEQDQEYKGELYPSAYRIYMSSNDEFEAAMILTDGDLRVWEKLCATKWFMQGKAVWGHHGLEKWRKDMAARDASLAKKTLREEAEAGNVAAARAILAEQKEGKKQKDAAPAKDPMEAIRKHLAAKAKKGESPLQKIDGGKS